MDYTLQQCNTRNTFIYVTNKQQVTDTGLRKMRHSNAHTNVEFLFVKEPAFISQPVRFDENHLMLTCSDM